MAAFGLRLAILGALFGGCAPRLPVPKAGSHVGDRYVAVPYPPPPAKVETIPSSPNEDAVWVDGQWRWNGTGYGWRPGQWVVAAEDAAYAPPSLVRLRNGELLYYEGSWREGSPPRPSP